ncbi:MAG TPA: hypothetical protein PLQ89_02665 [Phycisphaerae bacterium]|nr:hypothetical protein [Phycisphaerae bacterium]HOJ72369.1 hypothetical protein [Phycisphaerae bacterium]HOM49969.1 hypothetical protein [Phycisphaerae bacterium]HON68537.1 hypothetical protein [Phycisphaerae bacterium]HOQ84596.1 hypothetical protein [Phycisphaerae bacterium]
MPPTANVINVDALPERMREPARVYAGAIQEIARDNAVALAFYGLVVGGGFDPSAQPARNVLVLEKIDLEMLRILGQHGSRMAKSGIAAPVVMTPEYIARSLDTFPLELLEIQQQHVLVFGKDYFNDLTFDPAHVRTKCERELKTALLAMHDGLLSTSGRDRLLHDVVADVAEGLMRILRGIAWLEGEREARPTADTVARIETVTGRKLAGVRAALDPTQRHDWGTFQLLYDDVTALGNWIDAR